MKTTAGKMFDSFCRWKTIPENKKIGDIQKAN
jgi:hypothetical protein